MEVQEEDKEFSDNKIFLTKSQNLNILIIIKIIFKSDLFIYLPL